MMKLNISFLAIFFLGFLDIQAIKIDNDLEMSLELIKHQSCNYKPEKSKWERKLEFEGGSDVTGPKLIQRPDQPNCYSIGGKVHVYSEFKGDFSIYLELRTSANKKQVPESCSNQRPDGCGGFGSCLYCNACETLNTSKTLKAEILLDGKPISCGSGLQPGTYDNLELVFCLPDLDEMLKTQGLSKETFKSIIQNEVFLFMLIPRKDGDAPLRSLGIFATVYVFDKDVRKLMQTQMKVENVYRKSKRTFFKDEPLPAEVFWALPFNTIIKEQKVFIACHKIYGNVKIKTTA